MTENEMVGWHHRLNGCEFEQTPAVDEIRGSLACCSPQGCKETDTTERLNGSSVTIPGKLFWAFRHQVPERHKAHSTEAPAPDAPDVGPGCRSHWAPNRGDVVPKSLEGGSWAPHCSLPQTIPGMLADNANLLLLMKRQALHTVLSRSVVSNSLQPHGL